MYELVYTRRCGYNRILAIGFIAVGLGGWASIAACYKDRWPLLTLI